MWLGLCVSLRTCNSCHLQQRSVLGTEGVADRPTAFLPWSSLRVQLVLPVAAPVALYGGRVQEGQLGLKFLRVKQNPWDTGGCCV